MLILTPVWTIASKMKQKLSPQLVSLQIEASTCKRHYNIHHCCYFQYM